MVTRGVLTQMMDEQLNSIPLNPHTNFANIVKQIIMSPTSSADEQVIQQRGRRNIPVVDTSNPNTTSPFDESPESDNPNNVSSMSLRSSARKRLLYDSQEESDSDELNNGPNRKRMHTGQEVKLSDNDCLKSAMKALSSNQLIDLIGQIVSAHPDIEMEIRRNIPVPDLTPLEQSIKYLLRNIFKGLSNPILVSKTNHLAYKMVSTHVFLFKKFVVDQGRYLIHSCQWGTIIEYVFMAWKNVRKIPIWDVPSHNVAKIQCFKVLAAICSIALDKIKDTMSDDATEMIRKELNDMVLDDKKSVEICIRLLNE